MAKKTIHTYQPQEDHQIEFGDGTTFNLRRSIPGDILLEFLSGANTEDPSAMARTVRQLLDAAIREDELERWHDYIRNPDNNVSLETLSEIAGFASEVLSGGNPQQRPVSSLTG